MIDIDFNNLIKKVNNTSSIYTEGVVNKVIGLTVEVKGIKAFVGELCIIYNEKMLLLIVKSLDLKMVLLF